MKSVSYFTTYMVYVIYPAVRWSGAYQLKTKLDYINSLSKLYNHHIVLLPKGSEPHLTAVLVDNFFTVLLDIEHLL